MVAPQRLPRARVAILTCVLVVLPTGCDAGGGSHTPAAPNPSTPAAAASTGPSPSPPQSAAAPAPSPSIAAPSLDPSRVRTRAVPCSSRRMRSWSRAEYRRYWAGHGSAVLRSLRHVMTRSCGAFPTVASVEATESR